MSLARYWPVPKPSANEAAALPFASLQIDQHIAWFQRFGDRIESGCTCNQFLCGHAAEAGERLAGLLARWHREISA